MLLCTPAFGKRQTVIITMFFFFTCFVFLEPSKHFIVKDRVQFPTNKKNHLDL